MESKSSLAHKKILVTCGPVWTRIDPVRVLSNISSGELGHLVCQSLLARKAKVTLLQGPVTHFFSHPKLRTRSFTSFDELASLLTQELRQKKYDVVIHAAAVSDYQMKRPSSQKIRSSLPRLRLNLVPTPKLILRIKKVSPKTLLVGFKLQTSGTQASLKREARDLIKRAQCDIVLANIAHGKAYHASLINSDGKTIASARSRKDIVRRLVKTLGDLS